MRNIKCFINYLLTYILTLVVSYFLFVAIFSQGPGSSSPVLDNQVLMFPIFGTFFIVLPTLVSYFVAFNFEKNTREISGKAKIAVSLLLTLLVTGLIVVILPTLAKPISVPYTLTPVSVN